MKNVSTTCNLLIALQRKIYTSQTKAENYMKGNVHSYTTASHKCFSIRSASDLKKRKYLLRK